MKHLWNRLCAFVRPFWLLALTTLAVELGGAWERVQVAVLRALRRGMEASYPTFLLSFTAALVIAVAIKVADAALSCWRELTDLWADRRSLSRAAWKARFRPTS